ncbi:break repair meiotic recombinase recruitment factor 1 isoform X2 [Lissotriton helveticus]
MNKRKKMQASANGNNDAQAPRSKRAHKKQAQIEGKQEASHLEMEVLESNAEKGLERKDLNQKRAKNNASEESRLVLESAPPSASQIEERTSSQSMQHETSAFGSPVLSQMRPSQLRSFKVMELSTLSEPQKIVAPPSDTPKLLNVLVHDTKDRECSSIVQAQKQNMDQDSANGEGEDAFFCNGLAVIENRPGSIKVNKVGGEQCFVHLGTKTKMPRDSKAPVSSVVGREQLLNDPQAPTFPLAERKELLYDLSENIQSTQGEKNLSYPGCLQAAARVPIQTEPRASPCIISSQEVSKLQVLGPEPKPESGSQSKSPIILDLVQVPEKAEVTGEAGDRHSEGLENNHLNPLHVCSWATQQDEKRYQSAKAHDESGKEPLDCTPFYLVMPTVMDAGLTGATSETQSPKHLTSSPAQVQAALHESARTSHPSITQGPASFTAEQVTGDLSEETDLPDMSRPSLFPSIFSRVTLQEESSRVQAKENGVVEIELKPDKTPLTVHKPLPRVLLTRLENLRGYSEQKTAVGALGSLPPETLVKDTDERNPVLLIQKPLVQEASQLTQQVLSDASTRTGETLIVSGALGPAVSASQEDGPMTSGYAPVSHSNVPAARTDSCHAEGQTQDCRSPSQKQIKKCLDKGGSEDIRTQCPENRRLPIPVRGSRSPEPALPLTNDVQSEIWISDTQFREDLQKEPCLCSPHVATEYRKDLSKEMLCSSQTITDQDGTQIVQGLIVELSNLNRLIMNTHRDLECIRRLRHRRGRPGAKYLPHTGFISKKRKEM